jgi:hypothetical protein
MLTTSISKLRKLVPALFILLAVAFLSSCNSSNKVASSFGKRKYTKGHFSDPIAKLKMEYKPSNTAALSMAQPKKVEVKNTPAVQKSNTNASTTVAANNKATNAVANTAGTQTRHEALKVHSSKSTGISIAYNKLLTTSEKLGATTTQDNSVAGYNEHGSASSSSSGMNHYLKMCLIFLAIWLICILLVVVFAVGSVASGGTGFGAAVLFDLIAWICFLVSVVFFILWLIDISK